MGVKWVASLLFPNVGSTAVEAPAPDSAGRAVHINGPRAESIAGWLRKVDHSAVVVAQIVLRRTVRVENQTGLTGLDDRTRVKEDGSAPITEAIRTGAGKARLNSELYVRWQGVSRHGHRSRRRSRRRGVTPKLHGYSSRSRRNDDVAVALADGQVSVHAQHRQGCVICLVHMVLLEQGHQSYEADTGHRQP